jgi:hypothetical protein
MATTAFTIRDFNPRDSAYAGAREGLPCGSPFAFNYRYPLAIHAARNQRCTTEDENG